ncbi:MAG: TlpA family protein disulfide reductase [Anaerolineae bacterium]|jgi:cytochrome c biogenesis protein CcmG, thiol:disulfide interchange protein DsbE|nr:TlpA family protein disulfide reductase [Anaerolineae bacterium]MBT7073982.1 TlpA family protein disulfide reductase [Anaerolineae bacterium]MBT7783609.1 TlpA family protein disulfide reductase [Anaerolineae bacterium]
MAKKNKVRSRKTKKDLKKKSAPPVGLITMGVGIILIGLAAAFLMMNKDSVESGPEEYSSVPMEVDFLAPELSLTNLSGEKENLEDYHGQVVLVNLWATWCPPCKAELPVLQEFYEDHVEEGFVIIGIDSQEKPETVEKYLATINLTYPIWIDENGDGAKAFSSYTLPTSFVIDREGTVRLAWTGQISKYMLEEHVTPVIEQ